MKKISISFFLDFRIMMRFNNVIGSRPWDVTFSSTFTNFQALFKAFCSYSRPITNSSTFQALRLKFKHFSSLCAPCTLNATSERSLIFRCATPGGGGEMCSGTWKRGPKIAGGVISLWRCNKWSLFIIKMIVDLVVKEQPSKLAFTKRHCVLLVLEILCSSTKLWLLSTSYAWYVFHVFDRALSVYHLRSHRVRERLLWVYNATEHMVISKWFQISTSWTQKILNTRYH